MKKVGALHVVSVIVGLLVGCSTEDPSAETEGAQSENAATQGPGAAPVGNPNGKGAGGECAGGGDCKSGVCNVTSCTAPEKDVGKGCGGPADCESKVCVDTVCQPAKIDDGVKNGDETDVDCGGPGVDVPRCADEKACAAATDCTSEVCDAAAKTCTKPSATDGVKNADESDIDCGGTLTGAPKCNVGKTCVKHDDCASDGCDDSKHCANGRSCTQLNGGRTCGKGEVGQAGAEHESCCGALTIPGRGTKLDKYKITAGRMRAFVERTNGNVLGWYEANKGNLSSTQRNQIEPYKGYLPSDKLSYPYGTDYQLGGTSILPKRPSDSQGCFVGNGGNPAYGSHTYWNGALEQEDRGFDQAFLDRLPLNCVTYPMVAAFCAWDGGRVETMDEHQAAYGGSTYPWGAAPAAGGYAVVNGTWQLYGPATAPTGACPSCDPNRANWRNNYQFPAGGNAAKPWDYAYWMSPPGRFPAGAAPGGHADMAGNLMELTATTSGSETTTDLNGQTVTQTMVKWSKNGSWEGHGIGYTGFQFAFMTKYGKTGGRCARD
jgi:formylglycine-generating enzyme required for sulfatase activity